MVELWPRRIGGRRARGPGHGRPSQPRLRCRDDRCWRRLVVGQAVRVLADQFADQLPVSRFEEAEFEPDSRLAVWAGIPAPIPDDFSQTANRRVAVQLQFEASEAALGAGFRQLDGHAADGDVLAPALDHLVGVFELQLDGSSYRGGRGRSRRAARRLNGNLNDQRDSVTPSVTSARSDGGCSHSS